MLDDETVKQLKKAVAALKAPQESINALSALPQLQQLARSGLDFTIDLNASKNIGAPVIFAQPARDETWLNALTPRQQQVANAILNGHSNKQIARDLAISPATVKDHVHAILTRLKLKSRAEFIATRLEHKRK